MVPGAWSSLTSSSTWGSRWDVELDIDGAYAIEGPDEGPFRLDHPAPDNLWLAAKLGLYDYATVYALGWPVRSQGAAGPRRPRCRLRGSPSVWAYLGREHTLVLNLGGLVDPGAAISRVDPSASKGASMSISSLGVAHLSAQGELGEASVTSLPIATSCTPRRGSPGRPTTTSTSRPWP